MTKENLSSARQQLRVLRATFDRPVDDPTGQERHVTVKHLCRSLFDTLDDNYCREQLDLIELYAGDLFSERHDNWQWGPLSGVDALKHKIAKCLSAIESRLLAFKKAEAI